MEYLGLTPTGRIYKDVAADLIELEDSEQRIHHALHYREEYRGHSSINIAVDLAASFLAYPMVVGLAELVKYDTNEGLFIYSANRGYTLAEVIRKYRGLSKNLGIRAALEFCYETGRILAEAAENGANEGVFAHGDLSPARVFLTPEGRIEMLGYGLPQVEIQVYREDQAHILDVASLHYCPPERLEGNGEDVDADLYAVVLIAIHMMTGKPLYDGKIERVKQMVAMSEGPQLLTKLKGVPTKTMEIFQRALVYDAERRFRSAREFLDDVADALKSEGKKGEGLADIMKRIGSPGGKAGAAKGRGRRTVDDVASTSAYSKSRGGRKVEPEAEVEEFKEEKRWGKAERGRGAKEDEEAKPRRTRRGSKEKEEAKVEAAPAQEEAKPRRTRRGSSEDDEAPTRRTRSRSSEEEEAAPRSRRSRGSSAEEEEAAPRRRRSRGSSDEEEEAAPRRRRSRSSGDEEEEAAPRRRRSRSSGDEEEEAAPRRRRSRSSDD